MKPFHPDLAFAAAWLPRSVVTAWTLPLFRWLPFPRARLPEGVTRVVRDGVRIFAGVPRETPRPALLWIHGGGYVVGAAQQDDGLCGRLAAAIDAVVVSVDYRLAPEHPFPAPLDDCFAAFDLVHREAQALGVDPTRVAIGGQSAGGGLAAALALRIHDTRRPAPVLQLLVYPMLDDRTVLRELDPASMRVWGPSANRFGWTSYLGKDPGAADVPDHAAPARRVDLRGLPPAWVGVGTNDLFYDEDLAYAARLQEAGVATTLDVVDGAFHGFDAVLPNAPVSRAFYEAQVAALRRAFA